MIVGLASGLMAQHSRTSVARAGGHSAWVLTWLGLGLGLGLGLELGLGSGLEWGLASHLPSRAARRHACASTAQETPCRPG